MKTKAILSAAAWCLLTLAQAQEGTTPVPAKKTTSTPSDVQVPTTPQKSMYHECFVAAGPNTWKALGLDEQQSTRVSALQARYKAELNPPKEVKGKGKATAAKTPKATTAPPVTTRVDVDKEGVAVEEQKAEQGTVEASSPDPFDLTQAASVDDELRNILTPQQLALWEKKCASNEPTGDVKPE